MTTWTTCLLTGLRGNGKTLRAVQMMDDFIQSGVPVFASNFTDLTLPGVQFLEDPKEWQTLPAGSVLFVDEAQRYWRTRRSGDVPPEVIAMETQRHDGVRIVLLTQQPTFLDKHVRGLVDSHSHIVRRSGLQASQVYTWERCKDEPENPATLELADATVWTFPVKYFGMYKSAEVHTVKRKFPMKLKLVAVAVVAVVGMLWWAVNSFDHGEAKAADGSAVVSAEGDTSAERPQVTRSAEGIAASLRPRIEGATWTAPIYDGELELGEPAKLACMIGETAGCICITDQGTRYHMPQPECRLVVKNGGIFNPYKTKGQEQQERRQGTPTRRGAGTPAAMASDDAAPLPGAVIDAEQVAGYGDMGERKITAAP